ncbi:hypothetical protein [Longibaculum muris]|uniref:hypothetical protein n=1 Tax=Longibaculum muris TaxID=1796628 RepID=UPI0022E7A099|nr:hypothetical protein [Longibaculum muris]
MEALEKIMKFNNKFAKEKELKEILESGYVYCIYNFKPVTSRFNGKHSLIIEMSVNGSIIDVNLNVDVYESTKELEKNVTQLRYKGIECDKEQLELRNMKLDIDYKLKEQKEKLNEHLKEIYIWK